MNQILKRCTVPAAALLLGGIGAALCRNMMKTCFDELNLPIAGSGLKPFIIFCVIGLLLILLASQLFRSSEDWESAFQNILPCDIPLLIGAAGFLFSTVLFLTQGETAVEPSVFSYEGHLLPVMVAIGPVLAGVGLLFAANEGKFVPVSVMTPCLATCFWLVNTYHSNANDPVVLHFAWLILAAASSSLAWYAVSGFAVNKGRCRSTLFFMLLSVMLCLTALPCALYLYDKVFLVTQVVCFSGLSFRLLGNAQGIMEK